jgi:hypothetical protein
MSKLGIDTHVQRNVDLMKKVTTLLNLLICMCNLSNAKRLLNKMQYSNALRMYKKLPIPIIAATYRNARLRVAPMAMKHDSFTAFSSRCFIEDVCMHSHVLR